VVLRSMRSGEELWGLPGDHRQNLGAHLGKNSGYRSSREVFGGSQRGHLLQRPEVSMLDAIERGGQERPEKRVRREISQRSYVEIRRSH